MQEEWDPKEDLIQQLEMEDDLDLLIEAEEQKSGQKN